MMTRPLLEGLELRKHLSATAPVATGSAGATGGAALNIPFARAASSMTDLSGDVAAAVSDNHVPGGAAGVIKEGALVGIGAAGRRVAGKKQGITTEDRFHLGSSGKAMTSTMVARLIEEGKLDWNTRVVDLYPKLKGKITGSFENVTVWHLMTNRSGISDVTVQGGKSIVQLGTLKGSRMEQRQAMLPIVLKTKANGTPGARFEYSNFGYTVLGAMAERVTGTSFESLMSKYVFKPLGMTSAGFGAQGKDSKVYQPRGHSGGGKARSSTNDDVLPYLAPAGTMSMSVIDWGKFLKAHMGLKVGKTRLLQSATLDRLHTPYDGAGESYAAGWVVTEILGVKVLSHDGTNGHWYSTVQLVPDLEYAAFNVVNQGGVAGMSAAYGIKEKILGRVPFL